MTGRVEPTTKPGRLVRLNPLLPTSLPAHPDLDAKQSQHLGDLPKLDKFILDVLKEAENFVTGYIPASFIVKSDSKESAPAKAKVELLAHDLPAAAIPLEGRRSDLMFESWFARTSIHENKKEEGTADWAEFQSGLLDNHSKHEMEYTPDVYDAHQVLSWDQELANMDVDLCTKVSMSIYEMCHNIPAPLNNRVFSVLVVTGSSARGTEPFLVVQIPVDLVGIPKAIYTNGQHKKAGDTAQKKKSVTIGQYVSIERVELEEHGKTIKWEMATASDAKGILPMWMQKMGVPGAVVKDVGLFIGWTHKRRQRD